MELLTAARNFVDRTDAEGGRGARWRYLSATALIAAATGLGYFWTALPDSRNLSLVFFGAILLASSWLGMRVALFAAVLAFFSYNFFLVEPRFSLHFAPADVLALASFLIGAALVGGLSGRVSDRARDATQRLRDLTALFEASRDLSRAVEPEAAAQQVVRHLNLGGCRAAIWLGTAKAVRRVAFAAETEQAAGATDREVEAFLDSGSHEQVGARCWLIRLESGERTLGAVAIWTIEHASAPTSNRRWIEAILELGAVAIDRARLIREVAEATIVAEKEGLRTALLSSLSHDLRTPIATILASATSLQEHEGAFDAATKREMLDTIQDESERLNRYVGNLLEMTRLESGALQVKSVLIDPGEALASALARVGSRLKGRRVLRAFRTDGERILVDPVLIEQALINLIENAIAHTPDGSTILASTESERGCIVMAIEDEGPGISQGDLARVFDKFFRGRSDRRTGVGVGLGLSVSRGLVESFGGEVRAISPAAGGKGARMEIRLPAHPAMEPVE